MIDSKIKILLLTREGCEQSKKVQNFFNKDIFEIYNIVSKKMGERSPTETYSLFPDYIISFRSLFILPFKLLETVKKYSINFHPGPPSYPGSGSVNLALYNDDKTFGVTAHLINEHIDNGQIFNTRMFNIEPKDNVESLLLKTHQHLFCYSKKLLKIYFLNQMTILKKC